MSIFQSHANYVCASGALTSYPKRNVSILQKKALNIINFAPFHAHTSPLFNTCNILKFVDIINFECCFFVNNGFNKDSFSIFIKRFKLASATHSHNTSQLEMVSYLYQVITLSDSEENQLSTQPL